MGGALVIFIGALVWYGVPLVTSKEIAQKETITEGDVGEAISELLASGATSTSRNGFTVEVVPEAPENLPSAPALNRSIPATPDLDAQGRAVVVGKIETTVSALKENPTSFADWMDLGTLRLVVKDYEGAAEAWKYATALAPGSVTPYGNLGDLYANYLKDYPRAEGYLQTAIKNDTKGATYYRQLFELYLNYKSTSSAAEDTLKTAIEKFPDHLDHYVLLARYYRDQNRPQDARVMYDKAITVAKKGGNTQAASQLSAEKSAVK